VSNYETDDHSKQPKDRIPGISLILILISWTLTNFFFKPGNIDASIVILGIIFLIYKLKFKESPVKALEQSGVRKIDIKTLAKYVAILLPITFIIPQSLAFIMNVDMTELMNNQKSVGQAGLEIAKSHSKAVALVGLINQPIYGTFFEEFIFRGLLMRKLMKYGFIIANSVQALIFGFLHLAASIPLDIPVTYKVFLFIYPTIIGFVLGYGYKMTNNNLIVTWVPHFLVNAITGIVFVFFGKVI